MFSTIDGKLDSITSLRLIGDHYNKAWKVEEWVGIAADGTMQTRFL
jgi:hypothetical protein